MDREKFDYSKAQWAAIEAAVHPNRLGKRRRVILRNVASRYLFTAAPGTLSSPAKRAKSWNDVATKAGVLRAKLEKCLDESRAESYATSDGITDLTNKLTLECLFMGPFEMLGRLEEQAREQAHYCRQRGVTVRLLSTTGKKFKDERDMLKGTRIARFDLDVQRTPRLRYQFAVLGIWVNIGGKLTTTWENLAKGSDATTGAVTGPLVRYFCAVTEPVMKKDMPTPHGIRDIVKRYKDYLATLDNARPDRQRWEGLWERKIVLLPDIGRGE